MSKRERKKANKEMKKKQEEKDQKETFLKKLLYLGLVVLAAFLVWIFFQSPNRSDQQQTTPVAGDAWQIREEDHVKGNREASVVLVEYGDFQCPACAGYYPLTNQLAEMYQDELAIVYRHLPLRSIHKNAQIAAQAAEAAGMQDRFWEMHDILFEKQDEWSRIRDPRSEFVKYAQGLGLDTEKFETDMNSSEVKELVDSSYTEAVALAINSTPTFMLNGEKISLPPSLDAFSKEIDRLISETASDEVSSDDEEQDLQESTQSAN